MVQEDVIEVRPEILELLESFGASTISGLGKASCARSLALLKKTTKKRPCPTAHVDPRFRPGGSLAG